LKRADEQRTLMTMTTMRQRQKKMVGTCYATTQY